MTTLLERYDRHATLLGREPGNGMNWAQYGEVYDDPRLPPGVRANLGTARARRVNGEWQPSSAYGPFRQMVDGAVVLGDQTAVTGTSETALFPCAQYTGFAANQLRAGQKWALTVYGIGTTVGTPGNITITPRFGTTTGGTSLGASAATALVASATNSPWLLEAFLTVRTIGLAGANSTVIEYGRYTAAVATIAAATGNVVPFGSTASVSVDLSVAAGFFIGITLGSASDSWKALDVVLESLN